MKALLTATPKVFIGIDMHKGFWKVHCATNLCSGKTFSMPSGAEKLLVEI